MGSLIAKLFSLSNHSLVVWFYDRTILAPVIANSWFCWPLAPLIVWFVFRKIADDVLESSRLDGAGGLAQFIRFGLLANLTAVLGCWLISFAFCFGELSASQIVLPPGIDTIPRRMLGLLHAGVDEMTAALTIVTFGAILLVSLTGWAFLRLNQRRFSRQ
jgi:iron(III) transport system permease protein